MEGGRRLIVEQQFLCEFDTQCLLTVTQRQRKASVMRLSCGIRHIGRHLKVIEHRMAGLRHLEGYGDVKLSIIARHGLSIEDFDAITTVIQRFHVPVTAVGPPPEGCATHNLIADLGTLYRHPCETHGLALHRQRVACRIGLLHLWELDSEGGAFVFLHTEMVTLTIHHDGEHACQS